MRYVTLTAKLENDRWKRIERKLQEFDRLLERVEALLNPKPLPKVQISQVLERLAA